jgi:hypothetical protein
VASTHCVFPSWPYTILIVTCCISTCHCRDLWRKARQLSRSCNLKSGIEEGEMSSAGLSSMCMFPMESVQLPISYTHLWMSRSGDMMEAGEQLRNCPSKDAPGIGKVGLRATIRAHYFPSRSRLALLQQTTVLHTTHTQYASPLSFTRSKSCPRSRFTPNPPVRCSLPKHRPLSPYHYPLRQPVCHLS